MIHLQGLNKKQYYTLILAVLLSGLLLSFILLACPYGTSPSSLLPSDKEDDEDIPGILAQKNDPPSAIDKLPAYNSIDTIVDADNKSKLLDSNSVEHNPLIWQGVPKNYVSIYKTVLADLFYTQGSQRMDLTQQLNLTQTTFPFFIHHSNPRSLSHKNTYGIKIFNVRPTQNPVAAIILIDTNRDGDFTDSGEMLLQCELKNSKIYINGTEKDEYHLTFCIPDNAQNGLTLMYIFWGNMPLTDLNKILNDNKKQSGKDVYATQVLVKIEDVPPASPQP